MQVEIFVTPCLEAVVIAWVMTHAGVMKTLVEGGCICLGFLAVREDGRDIATTAKPAIAGDDHARIEMCCAYMRIAGVGDKGNAGCKETRILVGAWHVLAEFGREFTPDGRDIDANLLEYSATHHRHDTAAMECAVLVFASVPGCADKAASLGLVAQNRRITGYGLVFYCFIGSADPVAQCLEPVPCNFFERIMGHIVTNEGAKVFGFKVSLIAGSTFCFSRSSADPNS